MIHLSHSTYCVNLRNAGIRLPLLYIYHKGGDVTSELEEYGPKALIIFLPGPTERSWMRGVFERDSPRQARDASRSHSFGMTGVVVQDDRLAFGVAGPVPVKIFSPPIDSSGERLYRPYILVEGRVRRMVSVRCAAVVFEFAFTCDQGYYYPWSASRWKSADGLRFILPGV